jgi:hypothetical protein
MVSVGNPSLPAVVIHPDHDPARDPDVLRRDPGRRRHHDGRLCDARSALTLAFLDHWLNAA